MLKAIMDAFARSKAERDLEYGLAIVRARWLAYQSLNQRPSEHGIIEFAAPFIVPMMTQLAADSRWGHKPQSTRLDLIFVVLLADANTEVGQEKLRAMREELG